MGSPTMVARVPAKYFNLAAVLIAAENVFALVNM
jgi:hypothetical protein